VDSPARRPHLSLRGADGSSLILEPLRVRSGELVRVREPSVAGSSDHDRDEERYQARLDKFLHVSFVLLVLACLVFPIVWFGFVKH
jgi:hypothetical protein